MTYFSMASSKKQYRLALIVGIIIILPLGYWVRFHSPAPEWLNDLLGSVAYQILLMMLVAFCLPKTTPVWVAIGVCLFSCAIEFLQLWQAPFLQAIRATLPGRLVLGTTFSWSDFPAYFIGSFVGWVGMLSFINLTHS
ncbi:MAG: DUF2809 domain-containing protein [Coleofasciculaceae cyanobacterium]